MEGGTRGIARSSSPDSRWHALLLHCNECPRDMHSMSKGTLPGFKKIYTEGDMNGYCHLVCLELWMDTIFTAESSHINNLATVLRNSRNGHVEANKGPRVVLRCTIVRESENHIFFSSMHASLSPIHFYCCQLWDIFFHLLARSSLPRCSLNE